MYVLIRDYYNLKVLYHLSIDKVVVKVLVHAKPNL